MKRYPWSCLACGARNDAVADACHRCDCPAQPTYKQIALHRHRLLDSGLTLEPGAAQLAEPIDPEFATKVLLIPLGLVLGIWPFSKKKTE